MQYSIKEVFSPKLFQTLRHYNRSQFAQDALAGIIVGIVAIPLAIAFGISSGVGPTEYMLEYPRSAQTRRDTFAKQIKNTI